MKHISFKYQIIYILLIIATTACKKLVDVGSPSTSINDENVYNQDNTATSVLTGVYSQMSSSAFEGFGAGQQINSFSTVFMGLASDELFATTEASEDVSKYFQNRLTNNSDPNIWKSSFSNIYLCNAAIAGLEKSQNLSSYVKKQLLGEAKFLRALHYFYLVNLYGNVPLTFTTDYKKNSILSRSPVTDVYSSIIKDLTDAQTLLDDRYLNLDLKTTSSERIRPNKATATALLARTYLFIGDYRNAEIESSAIINNDVYQLPEPDKAFLNSSKEAIWQLMPVVQGYNTQDARLFNLTDVGTSSARPIYLNEHLYEAFEEGDLRMTAWIGIFTDKSVTPNANVYFPYKYKKSDYNEPVTEYQIVFRLAEQYLIRAEARIRLNNISGGIGDLNILRKRSRMLPTTQMPNPLPDLSSSLSLTDALKAVIRERRVELFTEWGHRWFDLKRYKSFTDPSKDLIDEVLPEVAIDKGSTWNSFQKLMPIPANELILNKNLVQNTGY